MIGSGRVFDLILIGPYDARASYKNDSRPTIREVLEGWSLCLACWSCSPLCIGRFSERPVRGTNCVVELFVLNTFIVLLAIGLAIRASRERARRFELHRPQCNKIIADRAGDSVVSTGRCPSYGLQITSD